MQAVALVLAFGVSLAPALLAHLGGPGWRLDPSPWVPLALLPWIALAGWPRGERPGPSTPSLVGLLLPALALALAADLGAGRAQGAVIATAGWGVVLCAGLSLGARRGGALRAGIWLALVPGAAMLLAARGFVGNPGGPSGFERALEVSPLVWALERLSALRSGADAGGSTPVGPLAVVALLAVAGRWGRRPAQQGSAR